MKKELQQLDISCTKLSNQCEVLEESSSRLLILRCCICMVMKKTPLLCDVQLLSQLKGNLEEENRHLLVQIDTLMLQNRTLLEQTMESKDLFHVEERHYM